MSASFEEHQQVDCMIPIPSLHLTAGAVGVIVHSHAQGLAYEVEFLRTDGTTIGVETISASDLQPHATLEQEGLLHVPQIHPSSTSGDEEFAYRAQKAIDRTITTGNGLSADEVIAKLEKKLARAKHDEAARNSS